LKIESVFDFVRYLHLYSLQKRPLTF